MLILSFSVRFVEIHPGFVLNVIKKLKGEKIEGDEMLLFAARFDNEIKRN